MADVPVGRGAQIRQIAKMPDYAKFPMEQRCIQRQGFVTQGTPVALGRERELPGMRADPCTTAFPTAGATRNMPLTPDRRKAPAGGTHGGMRLR
jgi:hypothetical protein